MTTPADHTPRRQTAVDIGRRRRGHVCWFDSEKGFGFLVPDDGTDPVFVAYTAIQIDGYRTLHPGQPVEYTVTDTTRGPEADHVYPHHDPDSDPDLV